jgi:soluble lytic murein transglycosylase-like protein
MPTTISAGYAIPCALSLCAFALTPSISAATAAELQEAAAQRQLAAAARQVAAVAKFQSAATKPGEIPIFAASYDCEQLPDNEIRRLAAEAATQLVSAELIQSVIAEESAGRPCAVSVKGALGLMQLMPGTAAELDVSTPMDPVANVRGGTSYLNELINKYKGNLGLALAAYNAGPARIDAEGRVPDIPETQRYVANVLRRVSLSRDENRNEGSSQLRDRQDDK